MRCVFACFLKKHRSGKNNCLSFFFFKDTIFIFVLGGATFAEIGVVQRLLRDASPDSPDIIVGANTVSTPSEICKRVLGGRLQLSDLLGKARERRCQRA